MELANVIRNKVIQMVKNHPESFRFREPIVGFASAQDPLYAQLSDIIGVKQFLPTDILPTAQTVIVYFIPYSLEIVRSIQKQNNIVQQWSDNYTVTNLLLAAISDELQNELKNRGFAVKTEPPTNNYDPIQLTARWAHKSSACIAGIGTFGLNRLIITKSGTAGRLNSLVTDAFIPPTPRPAEPYCLYYRTGKCKACVEKCPSGALSTEGFDRFRCNAYLDGKNVHDLQQGCGMCSSGPCAAKGFE